MEPLQRCQQLDIDPHPHPRSRHQLPIPKENVNKKLKDQMLRFRDVHGKRQLTLI
jgi:hypothetical protein